MFVLAYSGVVLQKTIAGVFFRMASRKPHRCKPNQLPNLKKILPIRIYILLPSVL